jgi:hypothetical protein
MAESAHPAAASPSLRTYVWPLVLCVIGLDYFSTLAYLPSIAVEAVGARKALAPLAALGVVAVTLVAAVPVYCYIVGRSPHGKGALGMLERLVRGWVGKTLVLVLLGFVAADYVVTRSLSASDAAVHIVHDPFWRQLNLGGDALGSLLPAWISDRATEQLVVTVGLACLTFFFYALLLRGFRPPFMVLAAVVVGLYLLLNAVVIGSAAVYAAERPQLLLDWWTRDVPAQSGMHVNDLAGLIGPLSLLLMLTFPQLALGLSGFELSMVNAPLMRGRPGDDAAHPPPPAGAGQGGGSNVRNTRLMLVTAAVIMSLFVLGSIFAVSLLVPEAGLREDGQPVHRALAYLAHGGELAVGPGQTINPLFGPWFGLAYDAVTVVILGMAGASATIAFRGLAPHFLARFGMEPRWATRVGWTQHLFNVVILVVTVVFHASVTDQQWAYATSVLVLLASASVAAMLDVDVRWRGRLIRPLVVMPFAVVSLFLLSMIGSLFVRLELSGFVIALGFVAVLLATGFTSRWLRSTEPRFEGFAFADEASEKRWKEICQLEFQVLAPHRPGDVTLMALEEDVRRKHRLGQDTPIIFIEAFVGDPSDFSHAPLMRIEREGGREVIRVHRCASVAHVLASMALEFRRVGRPPELYFEWSHESPLAANLNFLLMGEGNIPWMVHELIRKAEPDPAKRPRVVIG